MATQVNLRLDEPFLKKAKSYATKHGYSNVQELIKETLREKLYEPRLSKQELLLIKSLAKATEEKGLWGSEKELMKKLS